LSLGQENFEGRRGIFSSIHLQRGDEVFVEGIKPYL